VFRNVADGLWKASEDAWHLGRHDICIELHRVTVEVDPTFAEAYSNAAWLMWSAGRDAEAIAMYQRNIEFNGKDYDPHFDLGMYYYGKKVYLDAEANFAEATRHSAPSQVWKMLAHTREKLGRYEDALETWESVRRMDPHDPVIDQNVRRIQEELTARLRNN